MDFEFSQIVHTSHAEILYACQPSVMAETTVNQRAFALIVFNIGISGFVYISAIFITVNTMSQHHMTGFRQTVVAWLRSWHSSI